MLDAVGWLSSYISDELTNKTLFLSYWTHSNLLRIWFTAATPKKLNCTTWQDNITNPRPHWDVKKLLHLEYKDNALAELLGHLEYNTRI